MQIANAAAAGTERLLHTFRKGSGRWSRFSCLLSAAAMPVCCEMRCMEFTFHEFSEGRPASLLMSSEPEGPCSQPWFISSNRDAGYLPARHRLRDRRLQRFLDLVAFFHLAALQRERDPGVGPSMAQGMPTEKFLTLVLGLLSGAFFLGSA